MRRKHEEAIEVVSTDLQIDEQLDAHRKGWAVQRWGLIFIFAFVLLAAAGVFGNGLASKTSHSAANITIESERLFRFEARMELKVKVTGVQSGGGVTVAFPNDYISALRVESIVPEPEKYQITGDAVAYSFSGDGNMDITFYVIPQKIGSLDGDIEVNGHTFELKHFIFP